MLIGIGNGKEPHAQVVVPGPPPARRIYIKGALGMNKMRGFGGEFDLGSSQHGLNMDCSLTAQKTAQAQNIPEPRNPKPPNTKTPTPGRPHPETLNT